jgi:benzoyl-CoA reductase/2-hydroxyglutaryl-CoA dehydratase subunit BcrC/BadD/HgdB
MPDDKKVAIKKINAAGPMKALMAAYFKELDEASKSGKKKVAWCTSVGPAELLRSLGFLVYFPENHGAMLGSTRMAADLIPAANASGYSPEICSYLTSDIGSFLLGKTPLQAMGIDRPPKPDVLVYNTSQCRDVQDWMYWYHRELGVPVLGIQTHRGIPGITDAHVRSVSSQMQDMIEPLEKIAGRKFDMGELKEVLRISRETTLAWEKILRAAEHVPSPITFFDGTIHMGPAVVLRGDQRATDYYHLLNAELEERIQNGVGAVEGERYRIYWEGMPIWGKLREHAELFAMHGGCVVCSTYCNSWIFKAFDPDDPFTSMARAYLEIFIIRDEMFKERYITEMIRRYRVNGILFHDSKTCPNNSNCRYGMPERLNKLNIPNITLHADLNDLRCYSEEQGRTNIEAFMEQLGG